MKSNSGTNGWNDLSCPNATDQFSTLNSKAKLKYKIGLMSYREMELLNNFDARKTGQWYWLSSPTFFSYSVVIYIAIVLLLARIAISLNSGTEYVAGDGSVTNPYIVEIE